MCLGSRKVENPVGTPLCAVSDHQALSTQLISRGSGRVGMRVARWSARLLCFTYEVTWNKIQNMMTDCLSRLSLPTVGDAEEEQDIVATVFRDNVHAMSVPEFTGLPN